MSENVPTTYEEVLDEQFLLRWSVKPHWANVTVYEVNGILMDGTPVYGNGISTEPDEEDLYLKAAVKWDGCSHVYFKEYLHLCGRGCFEQHVKLMQHVYNQAFRLMGRPPEDEPDGWMTIVGGNHDLG